MEDERGVPVEVVMVGDCDTSDAVQALVRAAREAMVNAAKHSGADKIDVYAEVDEERVEVFVRDRGRGFDLDGVAEDRMGVTGQHHRPDGPARRDGHGPFRARATEPKYDWRSTDEQHRHRPDAPPPVARAGPGAAWSWSTTTPCSAAG